MRAALILPALQFQCVHAQASLSDWLGLERCEMPRRAALFRQSDVTRALKGARCAGLSIGGVEIGPDGRIRVLVEGRAVAQESELDAWLKKEQRHARQA